MIKLFSKYWFSALFNIKHIIHQYNNTKFKDYY